MRKRWVRTLLRSTSGQGMTEYIIIVALIAVFAIGTVTLFGDNIRALFAAASDALSGQSQVTVQTQKAREVHTRSGTLKDFTKNLKGAAR